MERGTTVEDFEPLVGRAFVVTIGGASADVRLASVTRTDLGAAAPDGRSPFRLEFESIESVRIPQGTYEFTGEDGFAMPIFVVPVGATTSGGTILEAIFA